MKKDSVRKSYKLVIAKNVIPAEHYQAYFRRRPNRVYLSDDFVDGEKIIYSGYLDRAAGLWYRSDETGIEHLINEDEVEIHKININK